MRIIDMVELIAERCYKILGFKPEIIRPESLPHDYSAMLEYSIEKLKSTGFVLNKNMNAEIDATLLFCQNEFGQKV